MISQSSASSKAEPSNIDFSKSMTQLLGSLGNLNENLREGFGTVAACFDNWRHTMGSRHTSHKDRLLKLEHNLSARNTAIKNTQSLSSGVQLRLWLPSNTWNNTLSIIPRLSHDLEMSWQKVNTVMSSVDERMREFFNF